ADRLEDATVTLTGGRGLPPGLEPVVRRWLELELRAPLAILVDDVERADVELLASVVDGLEDRALLTVLATRDEGPFALARRWPGAAPHALRLGPLPFSRCVPPLRPGLRLSESDARAITKRSMGQPLLLEKLAQGSTDAALAIVAAQLERNEPDARHVLRAACAAEEPFTPAAVEALAELGGAEAGRWLEIRADRGVLEPDRCRTRDRRYRFATPLHREVLQRQIAGADWGQSTPPVCIQQSM